MEGLVLPQALHVKLTYHDLLESFFTLLVKGRRIPVHRCQSSPAFARVCSGDALHVLQAAGNESSNHYVGNVSKNVSPFALVLPI